MEIERLKRRVVTLGAELQKKIVRTQRKMMLNRGAYHWNAPGMPPPGPNFLRLTDHEEKDDPPELKTVFMKEKKTGKLIYRPSQRLDTLYRRALREPLFPLRVEVRPGQPPKEVTFVPGHIWGQHMAAFIQSEMDPYVKPPVTDGPHPAKVMVIGKMPWKEESEKCRYLVGSTGEILLEAMIEARISRQEMANWYVTSLVKFMPPDDQTTLKSGWIADCMPLLHQELRIVKPDYILLLGADASKALLGSKAGVGYMEGRLVPFEFPVHFDEDSEPIIHQAMCMTVVHPAQVARDPASRRTLERGCGRFAFVLKEAKTGLTETDIDHRKCTSWEEYLAWEEEAAADLANEPPGMNIIAIDAEWEGTHPVNSNSYVRTIQMSWGHKKAICFVLNDTEGKCCFKDKNGKDATARLAKATTKFVNQYRIVGHFFVADLEHLVYHGFDFRKGFFIPTEDAEDGTPFWVRCMQGEGGLDTGMMIHSIEETALLGLESVAMRYTTCPRYDIALEDSVVELCKQLKIKRKALEGYGKIPDDILVPYGNYDADATRRIAVTAMGYLDEDYEFNCVWEPFGGSMLTLPIILEIHQQGIFVDIKRVKKLTRDFSTARASLEQDIVDEFGWPEFNIRSVQHVKEVLFGVEYNGKVTKDGEPIRLRPKGAKCLRVEPLLTTDKPPKKWSDIVAMGRTRDHTPGTGKAVLAILAQENPEVADQINMIRDYRFLDQVLKSLLRTPEEDANQNWITQKDEQGNILLDDEGGEEYEFTEGIAGCIDDDGMVRTHLYPTAETGRWKSSRPNLQNISKTRDPDYERLLVGDDGKTLYKHKLRSIFRSPPPGTLTPQTFWKDGKKVEGWVATTAEDEWELGERDLMGAELRGMAIMSNSTLMIDHTARALTYAEDGYSIDGMRCTHGEAGAPLKKCKTCPYPHPEFHDIHSSVAKMAFKLSCHPSKPGLASIGKVHLRNIAKTVIFGIAYGRQAKAIALAAKEQRKPGEPEVSVDDAQAVIDAVFAMYPELQDFFAEARFRAVNVGWLCNCFGRMRRFPATSDSKLEGEFERQAMNFPIQSMIADFVDRWLSVLHQARERLLPEFGEYIFYWQLQIHDALLIRNKKKYRDYIHNVLIPWSLTQVPIYPTRLNGTPIEGRGPYYLGSDKEICTWWGEKI